MCILLSEVCPALTCFPRHICEKIGCFCLFATHFHELTQLSESTPVKNRHVTAHVDENTGALAFLYEVADGPCTESFGIKVAELAGFPPATVTVAKRKAEELESNSGGKLKALRA